MPAAALYGAMTARTATRAMVLMQLAFMVIGIGLYVAYEDVLLHEDLVQIKEALSASQSSRGLYIGGVVLVLYVIGLGGLFFMALWARWLFTASWLVLTLYPLTDWTMVSIEVDVLQVPWAILDIIGGATLAVVWLNAWSTRGMASAAEGVDSPR